MSKALLIIDVQNDFMPSGALPVPNGDKIVPKINALCTYFKFIIWTKDCHPEDHCSFHEHGGQWPKHCIIDTPGCELHPGLIFRQDDYIQLKAQERDSEAYSPFFDINGKDLGFTGFLKTIAITELFICGLATEYCVKSTVLDAIKQGFTVTVVADGIAGIDDNDARLAVHEMVQAGVKFELSHILAKELFAKKLLLKENV